MSNYPLTRDDVVLSKPRQLRIPFLLRFQVTIVSVAGSDYEISTVKTPFGTGTEVRTAHASLVQLDFADIEVAITALLAVLNTEASKQS